MKRILITGSDSYIGQSLERYLAKHSEQYWIDTLDMREVSWKEHNFSTYGVVFHVAGIAHVSVDPNLKDIYYRVNRDLVYETALKAKAEGVRQFIFMSSMIVYGDAARDRPVITRETIPQPVNFYGDSKLQAEMAIQSLSDADFKIVILRPPIIYGKNSKGNYPRLSKAARQLPFFPDIENERSMLHVDNLCEFVKTMIDNGEEGLFFPQNKEYVRTSDLVRMIAEIHGRKIYLTKLFNPIIYLLWPHVSLINRVFGSMTYDQIISDYRENYRRISFQESVERTEQADKVLDKQERHRT